MTPARFVFEENADAYDRWFDQNPGTFQEQLRLLRKVVPSDGINLEIGVGSGRFARPLGIVCGIDSSTSLLRIAKGREIEVVTGEGEHLPYRGRTFDLVLMMTVVCFLDDVAAAFSEAGRVLVHSGILVVGFLERDGAIARQYSPEDVKGRFLRYAKFRTLEEVSGYFSQAGFQEITVRSRVRGFCVMTGMNAGPA